MNDQHVAVALAVFGGGCIGLGVVILRALVVPHVMQARAKRAPRAKAVH